MDIHSLSQISQKPVSDQVASYLAAIRGAKEAASDARDVSSALEAFQDALPKWWQISELTRWSIAYEPFQKWQEFGRGLVTGAEHKFLSGETISICQAAGNVHATLEKFETIKLELEQSIEREQQKLQQTEARLKGLMSYELKNHQQAVSIAKSNQLDRSFGISACLALLGFFGGCVNGCNNHSRLNEAFFYGFVTAVVIWSVAYAVIYWWMNSSPDMSKKKAELNKSLSEKADLEHQAARFKQHIKLLKEHERFLQEAPSFL